MGARVEVESKGRFSGCSAAQDLLRAPWLLVHRFDRSMVEAGLSAAASPWAALLKRVFAGAGERNDPHRTWTIGYRMAAWELRRRSVELGS